MGLVAVVAAVGPAVGLVGCGGGSDTTGDGGNADVGGGCQVHGDPPVCIEIDEVCVHGLCVQDADGCASCHDFCDVPGETCQINDFTQGVCYSPATLVGGVCYTAGTRQAGDSCVEPNDCTPGLQCHDGGGGKKRCYVLCRDIGGGNYYCKTGTCTDTGLGYRVCI